MADGSSQGDKWCRGPMGIYWSALWLEANPGRKSREEFQLGIFPECLSTPPAALKSSQRSLCSPESRAMGHKTREGQCFRECWLLEFTYFSHDV